MAEAPERINTAISTAELERRWSAVRAAMAEHRIDALLMQANNDFMGGYVKYFTDVPATNGYPVTVVFPKDEGMTVVGQGPFGVVRELPPEGDGLRRGTARIMATPSYASAHYTAEYDAALAERTLERFAGGTVGLLGTAAMSFALVDYLEIPNLGEDADTTAAIAGQLAGAFHGARGIPGRWLQRLALRAEIQALADALHALNQGSDRAG